MGYYIYCRECDAGNPKPTLRELIEGPQCVQCGEKIHHPNVGREVLLEMLERIERIETHLGLPPP